MTALVPPLNRSSKENLKYHLFVNTEYNELDVWSDDLSKSAFKTVDAPPLAFDVTGLILGQRYKFAVVAENPEGVSQGVSIGGKDVKCVPKVIKVEVKPPPGGRKA